MEKIKKEKMKNLPKKYEQLNNCEKERDIYFEENLNICFQI